MEEGLWYCWVCDETYSDGFHDQDKHNKCLENMRKISEKE